MDGIFKNPLAFQRNCTMNQFRLAWVRLWQKRNIKYIRKWGNTLSPFFFICSLTIHCRTGNNYNVSIALVIQFVHPSINEYAAPDMRGLHTFLCELIISHASITRPGVEWDAKISKYKNKSRSQALEHFTVVFVVNNNAEQLRPFSVYIYLCTFEEN